MDLKVLAGNLGLNMEEFIDLVNVFIETAKKDITKFKEAGEKGEAEMAAEAAHSLKGSSGNMGFSALSEVAKQAEAEARNNSLDDVDGYVERFFEQLAVIENAR